MIKGLSKVPLIAPVTANASIYWTESTESDSVELMVWSWHPRYPIGVKQMIYKLFIGINVVRIDQASRSDLYLFFLFLYLLVLQS